MKEAGTQIIIQEVFGYWRSWDYKGLAANNIYPNQASSISNISPLSSPVSLYTFLYPPLTSLSHLYVYCLSFIHHSQPSPLWSPLCCAVGHNHLTVRPFHTESITSPQPLFIFIFQFTLPVTNPTKYSQTACLLHLRSHTVPMSLFHSEHRIIIYEMLCQDGLKQTGRKAVMCPSLSPQKPTVDVIFLFYFSHLKAQTAHTPLMSTISRII